MVKWKKKSKTSGHTSLKALKCYEHTYQQKLQNANRLEYSMKAQRRRNVEVFSCKVRYLLPTILKEEQITDDSLLILL